MRTVGLILSALLVSTIGCGGASGVGQASGVLAPAIIRTMKSGVFEVVRAAPVDGSVIYKERLPFELLPFGARNAKFVSVGTAFAISTSRFVTAAHVMPALSATSADSYFLRDQAGATYAIANIVKYSQYRDVVEFEIEGAIPKLVPLEIRSTTQIGDTVATVGNAEGQGIVARAGTITSLTPEPIDGNWKYLRFTAPASPGNSGGPLVDGDGRVVGVVLQRSPAENLNLALPISELTQLSSNESEFYLRAVSIDEGMKHSSFEWRFSSPMPSTFADLWARAQEDFAATRTKAFDRFAEKNGSELFPAPFKLQTFLREPTVPFGFGTYFDDEDGYWKVSTPKYSSRPLPSGGKVRHWISTDKRYGEILFDRPSSKPLASFFEASKEIGDAIVHAERLGIRFAGRNIEIESLGEPSKKHRWMDGHGRPWFSFAWEIPRNSEGLYVDCLTNPAGWACHWSTGPAWVERFHLDAAKRAAERTVFSYYGAVRDWVEYLALSEDYRPKVLSGASVRFDKQLTFDLRPFSGTVDLPALSEKSMLYTYVVGTPNEPTLDRVVEFKIMPDLETSTAYGITDILRALANSSERHRTLWNKLTAGTAPYDGTVKADGKQSVIRRAKAPAAPDATHVGLVFCRQNDDEPKPAWEAACTKFHAAVVVAPAK